MDKYNLVKMANNIGAYFQSEPYREEAISGIEQHLRKFWDPRMRTAIVQYVKDGGTDLSALVLEAVHRLIKS